MPGRTALAEERERVGDDAPGAGHRLDLGGGLAFDHWCVEAVSRTSCTSAKTASIGSLGVDTYEYAFRAVVLDDRLGPLVEDLEPVPDDLRGVVRAPLLESAHVEPLDGELVGNLEEEDGRELAVDLLEGPVERLRLRRPSAESRRG